MDVRQLRYFMGVVDAKSLSKASAQLHIAQPALGVQMRNLERELGVQLLYRHPRGVAPTEAGERLAEHAEGLLKQFERIRQDLVGFATTAAGRVLLFIGRTIPRTASASIAERCRRKFPDIQLVIMDTWQSQKLDISDGTEPDLVLTFRQHKDVQVISEPLVQDELVLAYSAKSEALPREIDFCAVAKRLLVLPSQHHHIRHLIDEAALALGHDLKVYCDVDSFDTIRELVIRQVADTLLPTALFHEDLIAKNVQIAKVKSHMLKRTLYLLHSSKQRRSYAVEVIRREIREIIQDFGKDCTFGWSYVA